VTRRDDRATWAGLVACLARGLRAPIKAVSCAIALPWRREGEREVGPPLLWSPGAGYKIAMPR
jgi:hypothetical protein